MQPRLGGARRDAEHHRDLGQGKVGVEVEDDHRPLIDRQCAKLAIHLIALGKGCRGVVRGRELEVRAGRQLDERSTPLLLGSDVARTNREPIDPWLPGVGIAKGG